MVLGFARSDVAASRTGKAIQLVDELVGVHLRDSLGFRFYFAT